MALNILNPAYKNSINQKFREKRFAFFKSLLKNVDMNKPVNILDVGGTEAYWQNVNFTDYNNIHITLLNLNEVPVKGKNFTSVKGDACNLKPYKDNHFDIVYSNSVIEHLFTLENQKKMADEVRRVGRMYYVQTPNYYFPIEPHWLFPLFQFLPYRLKVLLTKNFTLGHYAKSLTNEKARLRVDEVRLLTESEMLKLFPEAKMYHEKFFGLTKSLTSYYFPLS